jgi:Immunity protein Imm6
LIDTGKIKHFKAKTGILMNELVSNTDFLDEMKLLTYRAVLALPLIYSEHVVWNFEFSENQKTSIETGLSTSWRWLTDQSVTAYQIYETIYPMLRLTELDRDEKWMSAVSSVISAVYYVTWRADAYDFTHLKRNNRSLYGGDLFDVTREMTLEAKNQALEASSDLQKEMQWQDKVLSHLKIHYRAEKLGELGPGIPRDLGSRIAI